MDKYGVLGKRGKARALYAAILLLASTAVCFPQAADTGSDSGVSQSGDANAGFGLQASIFRYVQNTSVDLTRNLSDAKSYQLTPGDIFVLTLVYASSVASGGGSTAEYVLQLSPDYTLDVPILGQISVTGKDLLSLRTYVATELKATIPLHHANLVLSQPALFNVFVYGNVNRPGFFTANPTLRVTDAIALSEGFKSDGSFRQIRLERAGEYIELDISRFYSEADIDSNPVLQPGDVIFVPAAAKVVTINGEIRYPGDYELIETDTLDEVIRLAGGFLPTADTESVDIVRQNVDSRASTIRVASTEIDGFRMKNGDTIRIRSEIYKLERIAVEGAVWGESVSATDVISVPTGAVRVDIPFYEGMSVLDALEIVGGPTPFAESERAFVLRERTQRQIPVDVESLWSSRGTTSGITLEPGDTVVIPLKALNVFVTGMVNSPRSVSYTSGYTVNDYVLLAGGFIPDRANTMAIYLIDDAGKRKRVSRTDVVPRGSTIYVGKNPLYFVDDVFSNIFVATAWATSLITATTAIIQFVNFISSLIPDPAADTGD